MLERFGALAAMAIQNAKLHMQLQEELEEHTRKEESIRAIFNAANDAIFVCEADSLELLSCNYKAEAMLGHSLAEMQHLGIKEIDARYYGGKLLPAVAGLQAGERSSLVEIAGVNRQGESLVLESNHNKVMLGGRLCLIAALRDISARKRAEAELDRTQQYKLALLRSLPDLMVRFDASGCFIDYNQPDNFELYMPPEAFLGKHITEVFPVDISQKVLQCIGQLLEGGDPSRVLKIDYRLVQNETALDFEARFVKCGAGEVLAIIRDITQQKQTMQQLEFLGLYDRLTEVYNRNYFEERAMTISSKGAGIVVCDLDGLKLINDTMGIKPGMSCCRQLPGFCRPVSASRISLLESAVTSLPYWFLNRRQIRCGIWLLPSSRALRTPTPSISGHRSAFRSAGPRIMERSSIWMRCSSRLITTCTG